MNDERLSDEELRILVNYPDRAMTRHVRAAGLEVKALRRQVENQAAIIRALQAKVEGA